MELEIRRLTPDIFDDYLYFFCNVAFTDHRNGQDVIVRKELGDES